MQRSEYVGELNKSIFLTDTNMHIISVECVTTWIVQILNHYRLLQKLSLSGCIAYLYIAY